MMLTHNLAALFLLVQGCLWLLALLRGRWWHWWRWPLALTAVAGGMVPWLLVFLPRMPSWSVAKPINLWRYLYYYWGASLRGTTTYLEHYTLLLGSAALLFALACLAYALGHERGTGSADPGPAGPEPRLPLPQGAHQEQGRGQKQQPEAAAHRHIEHQRTHQC